MTYNEALNQIYEIVKEIYGDYIAVEILVNCEGIEVTTKDRPFTKGYSMQTINGEFVEKKEWSDE